MTDKTPSNIYILFILWFNDTICFSDRISTPELPPKNRVPQEKSLYEEIS